MILSSLVMSMHAVYMLQCALYSIYVTVYMLQCALYSIYVTVYMLQCALYSIYVTVYMLQCVSHELVTSDVSFASDNAEESAGPMTYLRQC